MRWILTILVIGWAAAASAAPSENGIVLESHTGERPADANRLLSPVLDELASRGYDVGSDVVGRRFEQRVSRPSTNGGLTATFGAQVDQGHKDYISGRFKEAIKVLGPLVENAQANPGAFAQNQSLREKLQKALVALALSNQRIGDSDAARAVIGEMLRSFPNASVSRAQYGPEAFAFFEEEKKVIQKTGTGTLVVKATNETAVIFVNERFVGTGGSARETVLAGTYRVFVQVGKQLSRVHHVTVSASGESTVTIDADFDKYVHTSPGWTGFRFQSTEIRDANESLFAAAFANSLDLRKAVVVIGFDSVRGKPAVVVSVVLLDGRESRRASVPLDPDPSIDRLRMLGRFAAGENAVPGIIVEEPRDTKKVAGATVPGKNVEIGDLRPVGERRDGGGGRGGAPLWGGWKWITGAAGLGAMGVGAYLLSVDGDCTDDQCTYNRETSVSGWLTLSSGIVLTGISVYLFVRGSGDDDEPSPAARGAFVVPVKNGAVAGYALTF